MKYKYACPGCFKEMVSEQKAYCSACRKHLLDNKKIIPTLPFDKETVDAHQQSVQLNIYRGKIEIVEKGPWILRPIPSVSGVRYIDDIPANRHLMMQIAHQVFGIQTASSGLIYFRDGEPAYLTRRFDILDGEEKKCKDLCSLSGLDDERCHNGPDALSYIRIAGMIKHHLPATLVEMEKFFSQLVFNYVICNTHTYGSHFAFLQRESGDFGLAPAHDLFSTILHFDNLPLLPLPLFDITSLTSDAPLPQRFTRSDFLRFAAQIGSWTVFLKRRMRSST